MTTPSGLFYFKIINKSHAQQKTEKILALHSYAQLYIAANALNVDADYSRDEKDFIRLAKYDLRI